MIQRGFNQEITYNLSLENGIIVTLITIITQKKTEILLIRVSI